MDDVIQQHARFFDHLVELIPARYYHGDGDDRVDLRTMKKAARAALKQEFKAKAKDNKRTKLNPDAPATALEIQQGAKASAGGSGDGTVGTAAMQLGKVSLSREELKAKLKRKIEVIQHQRSQQDKQELAAQAKEWRTKTLESSVKSKEQQHQKQKADQRAGKKRKPDSQAGEAAQEDSRHPRQAADTAPPQKQTPAQASVQQATKADQQQPAGGDELQFARVEFEESTRPGHVRHKKPTKEQLLAAAEAKQAERAAAGASQEGQVRAVHEAWRTAMARASGEKILDDPKLLRRSIKKEAKRKEKSSKAWQERKAAQQDQIDKKQQRRTDNLQSRVDTKISNKKAAREKKLLRAGFEGRKTGFIGSPKSAGGQTAASKQAAPGQK